MEWHSEKLIVGIRHKRLFRVSDFLGEIVDKLAPLQGYGPFPGNCFERIGRPDNMSIILYDKENTISVNCNIDGVILTCDMDAEPKLTIEDITKMFLQIVNIILPLTGGSESINRIGIINQFLFQGYENAAKTIFTNLLNLDLKGIPDNLVLRLALKNPAIEAIVNPEEKQDYKNVIIQINSDKTEEGETKPPDRIRLIVDYQIYYEPQRTLKNVLIENHFNETIEYWDTHLKKSNLSNLEEVKKIHG
ncbi:MAG: hypothetical protein AABY78_02095 [Nitrospirota bacterium]